ncbi:hypothetical protein Y032_0002g1017 [Ancylostoma ceylanicum]|uniref:Uncharacterized protein n=1 Tax=Ancylostoma ceylanicum TaxID=53326 RepID=A0A016VZ21_9BILA|nr:hypothetical protein Y032_0002g1017 [Ancylostoma ceylanicum]
MFRYYPTPAHPYHTARPVSRRFPTFGCRRILLTLLDPSPGIFLLPDVGARLSHRWTRLKMFPCYRTPAHPSHIAGQISGHFPASGRRRTLITPLDRFPTFGCRRTLVTSLDPSSGIFLLLDAGAPLPHR